MYSMDKSSKVKKQIDRYFLPAQINSNFILDIIRLEEKKNFSPSKLKQQTFSKITQQAKKLQLLKITGRQLNSNFIPFNIKINKTKQGPRETKLSPKKQIYKYKIQQILNEPIQGIVQTISKDPQSHLYTKQLQQLSKYRTMSISEHQLKCIKNIGSPETTTQESKESNQREHCQNLIMSNPILYRKILLAHHRIQTQKQQKVSSCEKKQKKSTLSQALISKRMTRNFKQQVPSSEKQLAPFQVKKFNNFIQYRQFMMAINLSNKIFVNPEADCQYKAFICKGNNGLLVKSIIKSRPWWTLRSYSDVDNCSLVWTQWKKTKLTNNLPNKQQKSQKISFYASNYYERMCSGAQQLQKRANSANVSKSQNFRRNSQILSNKNNQINKIVNLQNLTLNKYMNTQQTDGPYFSFTRKINEKKFEQTFKKFIPSHHYQQINAQIKTKQNSRRILNHVPGCLQLHSKKLLFLNMKKYYSKNNLQVFDFLPETHLIKQGIEDPNFIKFVERFEALQAEKNDQNQKHKIKNIWICKPGENSNRGNGITVVSTIQEVKNQIKSMNTNNRTLIVQKYMQNPYLYNKRKFDIRCYLLITTVNSTLKGYFFNEGYIRTTSKQYNLKNLDNKFVHLTNDAIQKKGEQYGKFQSCNKVSFSQFQKYLQAIDRDQPSKFQQARNKIKDIVIDIVKAVANKLNPNRKQYCFQLFGLDFMLDSKMKAYLIQANSNPCLQVDGTVLSKIIPTLIENTIRVAIDPLFPPPYSQSWKSSRFSPGNAVQQNKFQLIYDSLQDPNAKDSNLINQDMREFQEEEEMCDKQQQNQFQ